MSGLRRALVAAVLVATTAALLAVVFTQVLGGGSKSSPHGASKVVNRQPQVPANVPVPSSGQIYWGALIGPQLTGTQPPEDMRPVSELARDVGKGLSIVHFAAQFAQCANGQCVDEPFPTSYLERVRRYGGIPMLDFSSVTVGSGSSSDPVALTSVIDGKWDSYLTRFAQQVKAWGHPFFLRFDWEMNGDWFPWAVGVNGNTAAQYVQAWRHIHRIFTAVGADNASWVWCPNADPYGNLASLQDLYPGASYVDWTCLDGYNDGTDSLEPNDRWQSFDQIFQSTYNLVTHVIAPTKPMLIGEVASSEIGGSKAQWIASMLSRLPVDYPRIRALVWYDRGDDGWDYPIESSTASLAAFRQGIAGDTYAANRFASLGDGK